MTGPACWRGNHDLDLLDLLTVPTLVYVTFSPHSSWTDLSGC